jgi:phage terminase small subunit
MNHPLTAKREKFCQLVVAGETYTDAYLKAYQKPAGYNRKVAAEEGSRLAHDTDIVLRVQDLRRPVIRKVQKKLEYNLQMALEECETAHRLAYAQGDPKTMLKAVELRAKLVRLLGKKEINITHNHGLLDDTSTEVLLEMKREIENRRAKLEMNRGVVIEAQAKVVGCPP